MPGPNILIILADQLRRQALGLHGDPNVSTPHIDDLAARGVRFTNACSTYPVCVPFRFTLMTGEYAHSRYVPAIEWRMSPAERTLADEINDAGYETIYCGKWHLYGGHDHLPNHPSRKASLTPVPPAHQGRWKKWLGFDLCNNPFDTFYFEDDDPAPKPVPGYQTDGLFDIAMSYLDSRREPENPFCCVVSVEPPHFPLEAPERFLKPWKGRYVKLPPNFLCRDEAPTPDVHLTEKDREEALERLRIYYAMIENLDWNVGRMMDFLGDRGLREDTVVVLISDHGQMDGAHSERNTAKCHPFEESIGIPFIVADPRIPESHGRALDDVVCTEDIFPTILGLLDRTPANTLPGLDLAPLVRGEIPALDRDGVMLEFVHDLRPRKGLSYHSVYWRGFRTQRYTYAVLGDAKEGGKPWMFYDLREDPYQMRNLVNDPNYVDSVLAHHKKLMARMEETADHYVLAPAYGEPGMNLWADRPARQQEH